MKSVHKIESCRACNAFLKQRVRPIVVRLGCFFVCEHLYIMVLMTIRRSNTEVRLSQHVSTVAQCQTIIGIDL